MKVVFVDVNGVFVIGHNHVILDKTVAELKRIHDETGCKIVLSSSWRSRESKIQQVNSAFRSHGLPVLIGRTGFRYDRAEEILDFIRVWNQQKASQSLDSLRECSTEIQELQKNHSSMVLLFASSYRKLLTHPVYFSDFLDSVDINEEIESWVAIDDEPTLKKKIPNNFVMTDSLVGLDKQKADLVIKILNKLS